MLEIRSRIFPEITNEDRDDLQAVLDKISNNKESTILQLKVIYLKKKKEKYSNAVSQFFFL